MIRPQPDEDWGEAGREVGETPAQKDGGKGASRSGAGPAFSAAGAWKEVLLASLCSLRCSGRGRAYSNLRGRLKTKR